MKKRLRKKLCLGEFVDWGFYVISSPLTAEGKKYALDLEKVEPSSPDYDLLYKFIDWAESTDRKLMVGGGFSAGFFVSRCDGKCSSKLPKRICRGSTTEADRKLVEDFFAANPEYGRHYNISIGPLVDANRAGDDFLKMILKVSIPTV